MEDRNRELVDDPRREGAAPDNRQDGEGHAAGRRTGELEALFARFRAHAEASLAEGGRKDVHQARVHARRLSVLLEAWGGEAAAKVLVQLKKSRKRLGRVRDADVLIAWLKHRREAARESGDGRMARLLKRMIRRRSAARADGLEKLRRKLPKRLDKLEREWAVFRQESLPRLGEAADPSGELARLEDKFELRRLKYERAAIAEGADSGAALGRLHKVRLAAKELRYAAEAAGDALDGRGWERFTACKEIQKQLGGINDIRFRLEAVSLAKPGKSGSSREAKMRLQAELKAELKAGLEEVRLAKLP